MDSDKLFREYLETWPDVWITWPEKGREAMKSFWTPQDGDDHSTHHFGNALLAYIKAESINDNKIRPLSCSEWMQAYFKTVQGRNFAKAHMARHEPMLAWVSFNTPPLKDIMDGFIIYVIDNEVRPCLKA